jgi:hypothetical protein
VQIECRSVRNTFWACWSVQSSSQEVV